MAGGTGVFAPENIHGANGVMADSRPKHRNRSIDGLRGLLALDVFIGHAAGVHAVFPFNTGWLAVWVFFAMSAYVLIPIWDGRYGLFLISRFLRLWPLYAVCITAGYALGKIHPSLLQYAFLPISVVPPSVDGPIWSLGVEAVAMLFMPVFVWVSRGTTARALAAVIACVALTVVVDGKFIMGQYFILGAWASRYSFRLAFLENPLCQWFGKISYALYLSHVVVLQNMPGPIWVRIAVAFVVAQFLAVTVEKWSIAASRWARSQ